MRTMRRKSDSSRITGRHRLPFLPACLARARNRSALFRAGARPVPSILGIVCRYGLGNERVAIGKPYLKLANSAILLILNYSNAAVSLPQAISDRDWDFLAATLGITLLLCVVAFLAGWLIARFRKADQSDQVALMFGLGMNNNGTGLVLASMTLADHSQVLLPIIFYNLVQHLIAGTVDHLMFSRPDAEH